MRQIVIPKIGSVAAWRRHARALLAANVPPIDVLWSQNSDQDDLFALPQERHVGQKRSNFTASRAAVAQIEQALQHSDPETFARAYSVVWRLRSGQLKWGDRSDRELKTLLAQTKQIARDIHKMHAFVRFRELPSEAERRRFVAWFEPEHNIVEAATPFFTNRFGDMDWTIATPGLTARFLDGDLSFFATEKSCVSPQDATEELWRTYYASIFNPARLMTKAMCSEMPKKYWKNLPEAELIPDLIRTAHDRANEMREARPTEPNIRAGVVQRASLESKPKTGENDCWRRQAAACTRCALGACATQTVWGEGSEDAEIMVVGEQPGDIEDLSGRPFVGPAGQVLDRGLHRAGLNRSQLYLTNAVKHFKYKPRGKARLHMRPSAGEIEACRWWLDYELEKVGPRLVIALGSTAARALTGDGANVLSRRGLLECGMRTPNVFITVHPASILRSKTEEDREANYAKFANDLARVKTLLGSL